MSNTGGTQMINDLKENAKSNFTEDEIDKFVRMCTILASKSVLTAVAEVIKEGYTKHNLAKEESDRLVRRLTDLMPYDYSGYASIEVGGMPILLNVSLSICDRDYKTDIQVPDDPDFIKNLFGQYNFLKESAIKYWMQFCLEQPDIFKRICHYRADVDFSNLLVDAADNNNTTLYFDPECDKRIGIFCYYTDLQGKPFIKKNRK